MSDVRSKCGCPLSFTKILSMWMVVQVHVSKISRPSSRRQSTGVGRSLDIWMSSLLAKIVFTLFFFVTPHVTHQKMNPVTLRQVHPPPESMNPPFSALHTFKTPLKTIVGVIYYHSKGQDFFPPDCRNPPQYNVTDCLVEIY